MGTPAAPATPRRSGMASRFSSTAQMPLGRPERSITAGCSCPACPTTFSSCPIPTSTSAHRPGCHGRYWAARSVTSIPLAPAMIRTASKASADSARRPSPHGPRGSLSPVNTAATCWGCCGSDASSRAISASVGRRSTGISPPLFVCSVGCTTCAMANSATSMMPRDTLRANASSNPGSKLVAKYGRSASSGLITCVVLRRMSSAGSPQASKTPAGRNGVGRTST